MATPTGTISFDDLRTETGFTGAISLGDGKVQDLIGRTSSVDMATARGKTSYFSCQITASSTSPLNITDQARALGWQGTGDLAVSINSDVVLNTVYTGTNDWGLMYIFNYGTIAGTAGNGGDGGGGVLDMAAFSMFVYVGDGGSGGGWGLFNYTPSTNRIQRQHLLYNYGTIASGGGGGGGGCPSGWGYSYSADCAGGGAGGGGQGTIYNIASGKGGVGKSCTVINGGGNGYPGNPGSDGSIDGPGNPGGGSYDRFGKHTSDGGAGGSLGAGGGDGGNNTSGWGYFGSGGPAGYAIYNNANLVTYFTGTILGPIV
jgi:hypothetical protein